jgi:hypothetical protein
MKKTDVQINATYLVKVAGNLVPVRIDREHESGGWLGTSRKTGKAIRIKSPQRLRKRLDDAALVANTAKRASKDATDAPHRDTGERGRTVAKLSVLDAAAAVLAAVDEPMGSKELVEQMLADGLWQTGGKTPANTLYAAMLREISKKGDASRFRKVGRGRFALADQA